MERFHLTESVCEDVLESQFLHKSVNFFFMLVIINNELTDHAVAREPGGTFNVEGV
jgi:hypothetical protein